MKRFVTLAAAIATFGFVNAASAADMPMKAASAPMMAPAYNWTGFYLGVNGGYGWGNTTGSQLPTLFGGNPNITGGLVGGQLGYNFQMGSWVLGIEADYDWANINGNTPAGGGTATINSLGSARGRLGYAWDRLLLYGTGGFAWAQATGNNAGVSESHTHTGWAAGGGLEYGVTRNLSLKGEYLYTSLSAQNYFAATCGATCDVGANVSTIRLGANWRF
jgi:outer membrane immunogenic protein